MLKCLDGLMVCITAHGQGHLEPSCCVSRETQGNREKDKKELGGKGDQREKEKREKGKGWIA